MLWESAILSSLPVQKRDKTAQKTGFKKMQLITNQSVGKSKIVSEFLALSAKIAETRYNTEFRRFLTTEPGQNRDSYYQRSFPAEKMERNKKNV